MQSLPCDCGRNLCKVILSRFPQILQDLALSKSAASITTMGSCLFTLTYKVISIRF